MKSPAERAKALLEHLFDDFDGWPDWWEEDIAAAIEAAQRDALMGSGRNLADATPSSPEMKT